jgi:hypothetical protein
MVVFYLTQALLASLLWTPLKGLKGRLSGLPTHIKLGWK